MSSQLKTPSCLWYIALLFCFLEIIRQLPLGVLGFYSKPYTHDLALSVREYESSLGISSKSFVIVTWNSCICDWINGPNFTVTHFIPSLKYCPLKSSIAFTASLQLRLIEAYTRSVLWRLFRTWMIFNRLMTIFEASGLHSVNHPKSLLDHLNVSMDEYSSLDWIGCVFTVGMRRLT